MCCAAAAGPQAGAGAGAAARRSPGAGRAPARAPIARRTPGSPVAPAWSWEPALQPATRGMPRVRSDEGREARCSQRTSPAFSDVDPRPSRRRPLPPPHCNTQARPAGPGADEGAFAPYAPLGGRYPLDPGRQGRGPMRGLRPLRAPRGALPAGPGFHARPARQGPAGPMRGPCPGAQMDEGGAFASVTTVGGPLNRGSGRRAPSGDPEPRVSNRGVAPAPLLRAPWGCGRRFTRALSARRACAERARRAA